MTEIWPKLAEPFPDSEVKQRPGRGNMTFSYVDARAVMQRLDDVLTPSGWDFTSSVIPGSDVVHGVLTIGGVTREDYGYPNSDHDEEPIKAASSDALKRCGVMFGIGRHLYSDNSPGAGRAATPPVRPVASPAHVDDPYADLPNEWEDRPDGKAAPVAGGVCPEHNIAWNLKPAGVSKAGKAYDAFWTCSGKTDGEFCREKPSKAWQARHEG